MSYKLIEVENKIPVSGLLSSVDENDEDNLYFWLIICNYKLCLILVCYFILKSTIFYLFRRYNSIIIFKILLI